jgi:hypothetical protein
MVVTHKSAPIATGNQTGTSPPDMRNPTAVTKNITTKTDVTTPALCDFFVIRVMRPNEKCSHAGPEALECRQDAIPSLAAACG